MTIMELRNVGFVYPGTDKWVFRELNLEIRRGEVVRLVGRNGAGKSTLLKVISDIYQPTEGRVVHKIDTTVAYMDQSANQMLASGLTVYEQVRVAAAVSRRIGLPAPEGLLRAFDLDLHLRLDSFVGHLSGGQRQIIALLCTIFSGATLICLDEFTSALDERSAHVSEEILQGLVSEGSISIALVSHSGTRINLDRELDLSA